MKDGPKELLPKRVDVPQKRGDTFESLTNDSRSSQRRILLVLETVIRYGPISLQDLTELLGLSQSATYRAIQHLVDYGWVQKAGPRAGFFASQTLGLLLAQGAFGTVNDATALDMIRKATSVANVHIDFALLDILNSSVMYFISSDLETPLFEPLLLTQDLAGRTAVSALKPQDRVSFLKSYLSNAPNDERRRSEEAEFATYFSFPQNKSFLWSNDHTCVAVAWTDNKGSFGSMQIRHKNPDIEAAPELGRALRALVKKQSTTPTKAFELLFHPNDLADLMPH